MANPKLSSIDKHIKLNETTFQELMTLLEAINFKRHEDGEKPLSISEYISNLIHGAYADLFDSDRQESKLNQEREYFTNCLQLVNTENTKRLYEKLNNLDLLLNCLLVNTELDKREAKDLASEVFENSYKLNEVVTELNTLHELKEKGGLRSE